jgi:hypothetical protein
MLLVWMVVLLPDGYHGDEHTLHSYLTLLYDHHANQHPHKFALRLLTKMVAHYTCGSYQIQHFQEFLERVLM